MFTKPDGFPKTHGGFGVSLSGLVQLPYRLSAGLGFDWERYTFDSKNSGDPRTDEPRYVDEPLTHTRAQALVQWDILSSERFTPFVLVAAGYGWEEAELTSWQCSPRLASGPVFGAGAGLDVALSSLLALGVEYRFNTLPWSTSTCTAAFIADEPLNPPRDFDSHRFGLTVSVRR